MSEAIVSALPQRRPFLPSPPGVLLAQGACRVLDGEEAWGPPLTSSFYLPADCKSDIKFTFPWVICIRRGAPATTSHFKGLGLGIVGVTLQLDRHHCWKNHLGP